MLCLKISENRKSMAMKVKIGIKMRKIEFMNLWNTRESAQRQNGRRSGIGHYCACTYCHELPIHRPPGGRRGHCRLVHERPGPLGAPQRECQGKSQTGTPRHHSADVSSYIWRRVFCGVEPPVDILVCVMFAYFMWTWWSASHNALRYAYTSRFGSHLS